MALPKHRHSKTRKRKKMTGKGISAPHLIKCPHCSSPMRPHRACPNCGYYAGRSAVTVQEKA